MEWPDPAVQATFAAQASRGRAGVGLRPSPTSPARTVEAGTGHDLEVLPPCGFCPEEQIASPVASKHHPRCTPLVGLRGSAEQLGLLHREAVQLPDESVPPSRCVSKIRIHAYRWELHSE
jgi:hypothetical protein